MSYSVGPSNGHAVDTTALVGMHKIMAEGKAKGKPVVGESVIRASPTPLSVNGGQTDLLLLVFRWGIKADKILIHSGSWLQLPGATLARMTAQLGFDYVLLDCEHGNIDDGMMHNMVLGITSVPGVGAMVRIPASENWFVKRALDTGAHGILVPMVSTVVSDLSMNLLAH